jgi:hypothetical protein
MKKTNNDLADNAPEDATFASNNNYYKIGERGADCGGNLPCFMEHYKGDQWYQTDRPDIDIRSLSDIKHIIHLESLIK